MWKQSSIATFSCDSFPFSLFQYLAQGESWARERGEKRFVFLTSASTQWAAEFQELNKWQEGVQVLPARNVGEPISQIRQMRAPNDLPT